MYSSESFKKIIAWTLIASMVNPALIAPAFAPKRLVVDPRANYFWTSCATAAANELADRAIPVDSRLLVRMHACLRR